MSGAPWAPVSGSNGRVPKMDRSAFAHMAATETTHWWFAGRRSVIDAVLDQIDLPQDGMILEAGCGTGGNLASLARRGRITAFDPHIDALAFAQSRHPDVDIRHGALPSELPYDEASFDLVAALDVLEHVEDDRASAHALVSLVRPGGWLIVTVPAHQALWGTHDRRLHHLRRYGKRQLPGPLRRVRRRARADDTVQHRALAPRDHLPHRRASSRDGLRQSGAESARAAECSARRTVPSRIHVGPTGRGDPVRLVLCRSLPTENMKSS